MVAADVGGVGRHGDAACRHDRKVGDAPFGAVFGDQRDAVTILEAHAAKCFGQEAHLLG